MNIEEEMSKEEQFFLDGKKLKIQEEYKYLGAETGKSRGRWNSMLERLFSNATKALNLMLWQSGGSDGLPPTILARQWVAVVRPLLEYGAELWQGEISKTWVNRLERL